MITIIDSGGANISSIQFSFARLGAIAQLSNDPDIIKKSSHLVLPGVGPAGRAMDCLKKNSLINVVRGLTQPVLGICLGMQILFDFSEEGNIECLGLLPGRIRKLSTHHTLTVPHMGWNQLAVVKNSPLLNNVSTLSYVYFIHSYMAPMGTFTTAMACYGENFSASVQYNNFYGTQFHPERSSTVGAMILKNFLEL